MNNSNLCYARRKTTNIKNNNPLDVAKQYVETYSLSFSAARGPEKRLEIKINKLMISQLYIATIIIKARMTQISRQNLQVIVPKCSTDDTPSCRQNNRELKHAPFWDADGKRQWAIFTFNLP